MSTVQWILLVVAVCIVVGIYVYSRRDRRLMHLHADGGGEAPLLPPREQQLDIFAGGEFDEFGVGKPRRVAPRAGTAPHTTPVMRSAPERPKARGSRIAPVADLLAPGAAEPAGVVIPQAAAPEAPSQPAPAVDRPEEDQPPTREKIVSLLVAERTGAVISGVRLHAALHKQKLEYGARQIYHRMHDGDPVFSVASLVKPGLLDPGQAANFSTPGLMLFMVLPGPQKPAVAVRDMLATAGRLAESLNGCVYDAGRKPLTPGAGRALQLEVESWSVRNHAG